MLQQHQLKDINFQSWVYNDCSSFYSYCCVIILLKSYLHRIERMGMYTRTFNNSAMETVSRLSSSSPSLRVCLLATEQQVNHTQKCANNAAEYATRAVHNKQWQSQYNGRAVHKLILDINFHIACKISFFFFAKILYFFPSVP